MSPASDPPVGLGGISSEARQAFNKMNHKMRKSTPETKTRLDTVNCSCTLNTKQFDEIPFSNFIQSSHGAEFMKYSGNLFTKSTHRRCFQTSTLFPAGLHKPTKFTRAH